MSLARVIATAWRENLLFSVLVELTYRCNLDCFFCYNDLGLRGEPLSREEYFRLFAELREMEVLNLTLTGGEPLAHPDFLALGARARELGFVVRVKSNGHALRGELARRVRDEVDPFLIEVSLHGATAATHDRQTRVPGSFDRLLANLARAAGAGAAGEAQQHPHRLERGGDRGDVRPRRRPGPAAPGRSGSDAARRRRPRAAAGDRQPRGGAPALPPAVRARARGGGGAGATVQVARGGDDGTLPTPVDKHCGAGSSGLAIDPYGNVYPCVQWRRPVGNLHRQGLREIWRGSAGLAEVRGLTVEVKERLAAEGAGGHLLNFCPGSAAIQAGTPFELYPAAVQRRELLEQVMAEESGGKRPLLPVVR